MASAAISRHTRSKFGNLSEVIGNTPLLAITFSYKKTVRTLYAKAEHLNLTGSIKDRMALHILRCAFQEERLRPESTIVEATSGNTGISFAAIGKALGYQVVIYMPDWMSRERVSVDRMLWGKGQLRQPGRWRLSG